MDSNINREYTYNEWINLDKQTRIDIMNRFWNRYELEKGLFTQNNIVNEFKNLYKDKFNKILAVGFGYFGWDVECIYVIVIDSKIKFPNHFADLYVNKGIIQEKLDYNKYVIKWRYGGSKNICEIKDDLTFKNLGLYNWRKRNKK